MKKFIFVVFSFFVLFSCTNKVEKDIKNYLGEGFSFSQVKSIDINEDFYEYTYEYYIHCVKYDTCREITKMLGDAMRDFQNDMEKYKSIGYTNSYEFAKKTYEKYKTEWEDSCKRLDEYSKINENFINNGKQSGKLYVAKYKVKNEYTNKNEKFYSYDVFAYNTDGTLGEVNKNKIQIICSVYPNAKKDFQKALKEAQSVLLGKNVIYY